MSSGHNLEHWELDVQNITNCHSANKISVLCVGRPNGSGGSPNLLHIGLISTPSWLCSGHNREPLGTWCATRNEWPFGQTKPAFYGSDDLTAVVKVLFYFAYVLCRPCCDCPVANIWNYWELDVQDTMYGHYVNISSVFMSDNPKCTCHTGQIWAPAYMHIKFPVVPDCGRWTSNDERIAWC